MEEFVLPNINPSTGRNSVVHFTEHLEPATTRDSQPYKCTGNIFGRHNSVVQMPE